MKNKFRHGKLIGTTVIGLAAVSLVTVGFSSWIIANESTVSKGDVTVSVAGVQDQTIDITNLAIDDGAINFDARNGDNAGFITASSTTNEDLDFAISFKIDMTGKNFKGISIAAHEAKAALTSYASSNYIKLPLKMTSEAIAEKDYIPLIDSKWTTNATTKYITYGSDFATATAKDTAGGHDVKVEVSGTNQKDLTFKCTLSFKWGSMFNNDNPSLFDDTWKNASSAQTALEAMNKETHNFDLSLKHNPTELVSIKTVA